MSPTDISLSAHIPSSSSHFIIIIVTISYIQTSDFTILITEWVYAWQHVLHPKEWATAVQSQTAWQLITPSHVCRLRIHVQHQHQCIGFAYDLQASYTIPDYACHLGTSRHPRHCLSVLQPHHLPAAPLACLAPSLQSQVLLPRPLLPEG